MRKPFVVTEHSEGVTAKQSKLSNHDRPFDKLRANGDVEDPS